MCIRDSPGGAGPVGIIAGTGFYTLASLADAEDRDVETPYGVARVTQGTWHGLEVAFVTRHGTGHSVPPHLVNYRAVSYTHLSLLDFISSTEVCISS